MLPINERHFEYWRAQAKAFESLAQYIAVPANPTGSGEATQITVVRASGSLFDVLQVQASIGRTLTGSIRIVSAAGLESTTKKVARCVSIGGYSAASLAG